MKTLSKILFFGFKKELKGANSRCDENKIGKGKFALVEYEKLRRITIPLGYERLLLITLDNTDNDLTVIENILNQIKFPKS